MEMSLFVRACALECHRPINLSLKMVIIFKYLGARKNHLIIEMVLLSAHNICFWLRNIILTLCIRVTPK